MSTPHNQDRKTRVSTRGKRIANEIFQGQLTVTLQGACSRTFGWTVVNKLPDREGSIRVTADSHDLISFGGRITEEKVAALSPAQQFFFHLVAGEVGDLIQALSVHADGGVVQLVGSKEQSKLACIKEKPTGEVGDSASRNIALNLGEKELGFLSDIITGP